jgi:hypothetical protein
MYLMVVVVAAVDVVHNVSLAQSEPIRRCAYLCAEKKITRGGSWDPLGAQHACPAFIPKMLSPRSPLSTTLSPPVCLGVSCARRRLGAVGMIVWKLVIKDDPNEVTGSGDDQFSELLAQSRVESANFVLARGGKNASAGSGSARFTDARRPISGQWPAA